MKTNTYAFIVVFAIVISLIVLIIPGLKKSYSQTDGTSVIPNAESAFKSQSMKFTSSLLAYATIMVLYQMEHTRA